MCTDSDSSNVPTTITTTTTINKLSYHQAQLLSPSSNTPTRDMDAGSPTPSFDISLSEQRTDREESPSPFPERLTIPTNLSERILQACWVEQELSGVMNLDHFRVIITRNFGQEASCGLKPPVVPGCTHLIFWRFDAFWR